MEGVFDNLFDYLPDDEIKKEEDQFEKTIEQNKDENKNELFSCKEEAETELQKYLEEIKDRVNQKISENEITSKFKCNNCGYKSVNLRQMKKHQDSTHKNQETKVLRISCKKCEAGEEHDCIHKFSCNLCDRKTSTRNSATSND